MNKTNLNIVASELSGVSGQSPALLSTVADPVNPPVSELEAKLRLSRITTTTELPQMAFLFSMFGIQCFPRGELVAITGKAKSGKTFLTSVLMVLCCVREVLSVKRIDDKKLKLLWFDTEQSEGSTQDIMRNRLCPMIGPENFDEEQFEVYNVRGAHWQERLPLLELAMKHGNPDLVILDGIRDLVNDINDGVLAQDIVERLMRMATEHHCCIVAVIHQNKSGENNNLRGWIGTELMNKAFEVYACEKTGDRIFTWEQTHTRKYDILDKLKFTIDDSGMPHIASVEEWLEQDKARRGGSRVSDSPRPALNGEYVVATDGKCATLDLRRLFSDAMPDGLAVKAADLQKRVMELANITSAFFYNKQRECALAENIIMRTKNGDNQVLYFLQPPDEAPF